MTRPYTNPEGLSLNACNICGFCERFGCEHFAEASPQTVLLPKVFAQPNFEMRTHVHVTRVLLDNTGKRTTGVLYVDARGNEIEQPAEIVILCAYSLNDVKLLLNSGIGKPYDPATGEGTVGRNYTYQTMSSVGVFYPESVNLNPSMGAGALGTIVDDFNHDNFDHTGLGFVGGAYIAAWTNSGRPIEFHPTPPGTPRRGRDWKQAVRRHHNHTIVLEVEGNSMPTRAKHLSADPTYRDAYGHPALRITFDFPESDLRMSRYVTDRAVEIARLMGGEIVVPSYCYIAVLDRPLPDDAQQRWRGHGDGPGDERGEPLLAKLGRAEPLRPGGLCLPPESRQGRDRHGRRPRFLVGEGDPGTMPQEPGPVDDLTPRANAMPGPRAGAEGMRPPRWGTPRLCPRAGGRVSRAACAALLAAGSLSFAAAVRAQPTVRLWDGALVLQPYAVLQYDAATTFAHNREGGPGAGTHPRRSRLGVVAEILGDLEARLIWEFSSAPGNPARFYEASLAYKGLGPFALTGGAFKQQFSLERVQSAADILFLERAAIAEVASDVAAASRRLGVQVRVGGERWLAAAALTGGQTGASTDTDQRGAVARVAGLPVRSGDVALHLGLSGALSWKPQRVGGTRVVDLSDGPELEVERWGSPLGTGNIPARRARTGGVEAGLGWGRLWAQSEAYVIEVDRAGPRGGTLGFSGWYVQAAYTVLGKPRPWQPNGAVWGAPTPVEGGFNPARGLWGAVEVGARVSEIDLSDKDVRGGRQRVWTTGVSWWPVEPLRVILQYQHVTIRGTAEDRRFQAVALRGQLWF